MTPEIKLEVTVSDDKSLIDVDMVSKYLNEEARWSKGIPKEVVQRAMDNSLCFGAYIDAR